jgi:hypothetical protein
MTAPRRIRINRLILDGIDPHQQAAVVTALHTELARLFREHPDSVPKAPPNARNVTSPAEVGKRTAAAVHARVVRTC